MDQLELIEFNSKEELHKSNKNWNENDMVYIKETGELLLYYNGYWLNYLEGD